VNPYCQEWFLYTKLRSLFLFLAILAVPPNYANISCTRKPEMKGAIAGAYIGLSICIFKDFVLPFLQKQYYAYRLLKTHWTILKNNKNEWMPVYEEFIQLVDEKTSLMRDQQRTDELLRSIDEHKQRVKACLEDLRKWKNIIRLMDTNFLFGIFSPSLKKYKAQQVSAIDNLIKKYTNWWVESALHVFNHTRHAPNQAYPLIDLVNDLASIQEPQATINTPIAPAA
jgi:hypothetical protein